MAEKRDSPNVEDVEAVVDQLGDGDLALVQPGTLLAFYKRLYARLARRG